MEIKGYKNLIYFHFESFKYCQHAAAVCDGVATHGSVSLEVMRADGPSL